MTFTHVVVDGSNIATEGRSLPSLAQLEDAVGAFSTEFPKAQLTVVVDASFSHRINGSEKKQLDTAETEGRLVSPPAGAIGRGDAFLLRIAEKAGAAVLSNDSFQEFHGEHDWLFDEGRLIGGKPVPGVGWIFTPRSPVRGARSRVASRKVAKAASKEGTKTASNQVAKTASKRVAKTASKRVAKPASNKVAKPASNKVAKTASKQVAKPAKSALPRREPAKAAVSRESRGARDPAPPARRAAPRRVQKAIADASEEAVSDRAPARRRRSAAPPPEAVNDPLTFITFVAEHPLGSAVEGDVDSFTSHGFFVLVGDARCYVPLSGLGDPPPRRAREVVSKGERRGFVVQALDAPRRGVELALPGVAAVRGEPSEETVRADIASARKPRATAKPGAAGPERDGRRVQPAAPATKAVPPKKAAAKVDATGPARKGAGAAAPRLARAKKAPAPAPAKKSAQATARKAKAAAKKAPAKKAPAKKAPAAGKASQQQAPAKRARVKKAAAKRATAGRAASPGRASAARAPAGGRARSRGRSRR